MRAVIARADRPDVLAEAVAAAAAVGTTFEANDRRLPARKLWIAFASAPAGHLVVDDGARAGAGGAGHVAAAGRGDRGERASSTRATRST